MRTDASLVCNTGPGRTQSSREILSCSSSEASNTILYFVVCLPARRTARCVNGYSAFHKTFDKRFPKFATNLAISFRSCQSNRELANEVVKFTPNFVEKLYQVHYERSSRQIGEIVSECPYTLWLRRLGITSFKMGYKTLQLNFPRCHPTPT